MCPKFCEKKCERRCGKGSGPAGGGLRRCNNVSIAAPHFKLNSSFSYAGLAADSVEVSPQSAAAAEDLAKRVAVAAWHESYAAVVPTSCISLCGAGPDAESVEVSPQSAAVAEGLAKRVAASGGAALIIDYGNDAPATDSLRWATVIICWLMNAYARNVAACCIRQDCGRLLREMCLGIQCALLGKSWRSLIVPHPGPHRVDAAGSCSAALQLREQHAVPAQGHQGAHLCAPAGHARAGGPQRGHRL